MCGVLTLAALAPCGPPGPPVWSQIWAWEYVKQDPVAYWGEVPSDVKPRLHFYNTGITADTSSPDHPIAFIKKVVQPGDFLVSGGGSRVG